MENVPGHISRFRFVLIVKFNTRYPLAAKKSSPTALAGGDARPRYAF